MPTDLIDQHHRGLGVVVEDEVVGPRLARRAHLREPTNVEDVASGEVLSIEAVEPVSLAVSATRYTPHDLYVAANDVDVRERDEVVVCVDVAHRGLGTASCGPDVLPQYRLPAGRYEFAYRIGVR